MFTSRLAVLNKHWEYKYDKDQYASRDHWKVMTKAPYYGDCEDYALTALWLIGDKSWSKFWWRLFTFQAQLKLVHTKNGGGHGVLRYKNMYIDNWTKKFVTKEEMEKLGHVFQPVRFLPSTVAIKMLMAKVVEYWNGRRN